MLYDQLFSKVVEKFNQTSTKNSSSIKVRRSSGNNLVFETRKGEVPGKIKVDGDNVVVRWGNKEIQIPIQSLMGELN